MEHAQDVSVCSESSDSQLKVNWNIAITSKNSCLGHIQSEERVFFDAVE